MVKKQTKSKKQTRRTYLFLWQTNDKEVHSVAVADVNMKSAKQTLRKHLKVERLPNGTTGYWKGLISPEQAKKEGRTKIIGL